VLEGFVIQARREVRQLDLRREREEDWIWMAARYANSMVVSADDRLSSNDGAAEPPVIELLRTQGNTCRGLGWIGCLEALSMNPPI
jgi:hypothetical protein